MEAVTELLTHLPIDTGMVFVLVQHLDARQDEMLIELPQRATRMPVRMATDGTALIADCVFVHPPTAYMRIEGDALRLEPHAAPHHMPIDCFFHSLAESRRNRAVAVIFSGSGSDGAIGMKAVKAEGGITFAQDDSAKHRVMAQSAITPTCRCVRRLRIRPSMVSPMCSRFLRLQQCRFHLLQAPRPAPPHPPPDIRHGPE